MNSETFKMKSGDEVILREAIPEDAEKMIAYLDDIAGESDNLTFGPGEMRITLEEEKNFLEAANKSDNQLFLVALTGDKIIASLHFESSDRPRIAHIGEFGVSVLKDFWGNGLASKLISAMIGWAGSQGITKINLKVKEDNSKAIALYKKLGFEEEGILRRDFLIKGKYFNSLMMGLMIDES